MGAAYNVIDTDGHTLEPFDPWNKLTDPKHRDRAPRLVLGIASRCRPLFELVVAS